MKNENNTLQRPSYSYSSVYNLYANKHLCMFPFK